MPDPSRVTFSGLALVAACVVAGALLGPASDRPGDLLALCLTGVSQVAPGDVWGSWSLAPATVLPLAAALGIQMLGQMRDRRAGWPPSTLRQLSFGCGWLLLLVALVSPLCRLAANLAWAHMVQHVILVALAPPLLVLGASGIWRSGRVGDARPRLGPVAAGALYAIAIWGWHAPLLYQGALRDSSLHLVMYGSLLAASLIFWSSILAAARRNPADAVVAAPVLLVTVIHTGLLGALLVFSPGLWFPLMAPGALAFGLAPLEDQQLAGLIMWMPMSLVYLAAALAAVASGLAAPERRPAGPA